MTRYWVCMRLKGRGMGVDIVGMMFLRCMEHLLILSSSTSNHTSEANYISNAFQASEHPIG